MKSLIASIMILGLVGMIVGVTVQATEHTGTVTATVTPVTTISISLSTATVDYGVLSLSASDGSRTTELSTMITVTNNGDGQEDFNIKGSDSTNWTLNFSPVATGTVGADIFVHRFDANATFNTGTANALGLSSQALGAGNIVPLGTQNFVLQMNMPTTTSVNVQQSTTVTVVATASS